MKKLLLPMLVGCLSVSFTNKSTYPVAFHLSTTNSRLAVDEFAEATLLYEHIGLSNSGLSLQAFQYAYKGYRHLRDKSMLGNEAIITICDMSQSSRNRRMYIIDVEHEKLLRQTYVAHGMNSGLDYATRFSNKEESLQTSLGFFITRQPYIGKHGLSLRLEGVDGKFNNKAFERTIVIHGAAYVSAERAASGSFMGRSWGCPAVPEKESNAIIRTIENGTCLFIYHPEKEYLAGSTILND